MSFYGSQRALHTIRKSGSRGDLTPGGTYQYGGGNGYGPPDPYMDGYNTYTFSKSSSGAMVGAQGGSNLQQKAFILQGQCQEYLRKAEYAMQSGGLAGDVERYMGMAKETIELLKGCASDLRQMGQPNDNVVRSMEVCRDQLKGVHMAISGTMQRRARGSRGSWEEPGRSFTQAMAWIGQQKRLIETSHWADDSASIQQQLISHQKFHSSIQRSSEMEQAKEDLIRKGDKANLNALEQEWDNLQNMSFGRTEQLRELQQIIEDISKEIMWVNDREEAELVFDWGDKNIDQYIPSKQESYSKLMSVLEEKEKDLNKLKIKVDAALKNNHPASDKIQAYMDTLQTQWSWLLQITKCIHVHLKENAAYSQFFKEANDTYTTLQKDHETIRKKFTCDKNTSLDNLLELLKGLEREKEKITANKRQVQHLVSMSNSIVRLKPRNPEEKSSTQVIVRALCDFKQDQKVINKDNEGILKDNSQRSKWQVTGPGGLDMLVPSVCLLVPPPNPLTISLAKKNDEYYEAILSIWNQLYINIKSLISWQYCILDIKHINSLTMAMIARMHPEEYRSIIKTLETHFEDFKLNCYGSQMIADDDKKIIENQYNGAQAHYEQLVVQLPAYIVQQQQIEAQQNEQQRQQQLIIIQQQQIEAQQNEQLRQQQLILIQQQEQEAAAAEQEARRREEMRRKVEVKKVEVKKTETKREVMNKEQVVKKEMVRLSKAEPVKRKVASSSSSVSTSHSLSDLHVLRMRLEGAEGALTQHIHICLGEDGVYDCGHRITQLETVQRDIDSIRDEYLRLKERILKELEGMTDSDKAQFLGSEISVINQRLGSLEGSSSAYLQRLRALRDMLESVARAEDIVKVHEARLTEKETTSLVPGEVEDYMDTLRNMKAELDRKMDVLGSMEAELAKASHWNSQVGGSFYRCDMILSKYGEQVALLADRWRRIQNQMDSRIQDLDLYLAHLQHYKGSSTSLNEWIRATQQRQEVLQAAKIEDLQTLKEHSNQQKALNSEIKGKRETVDSVLKDSGVCVNSIKDYESDLASYSSGLETLLNIPIKRTMLMSPSTELTQEAGLLQSRYMELLTHASDYYKYLGEMLKNMEELKMRNTRIELLEEQLRLLKEDIRDRDAKNQELADAITRYQLELSNSQDQLLSVEEVKRNTTLQCSTTQENLESTHSQLSELKEQLERLQYQIEEEKRKWKLAEERYSKQSDEYETVLRKREKEVQDINWAKMEAEKNVADKKCEVEKLRRQLAEESARVRDLQMEMSKVRSLCSAEINTLKLSYESQIHASHTDIQHLSAQREEENTELQLKCDRMEAERNNLEEELRRQWLSISQAEENRRRAEEEAHSQRSVITEEGCRRRELEVQVEVLIRQREEDGDLHAEKLLELRKSLGEKSDQVAYLTHSLAEETRRRKTIEEGQAVMEDTLVQLQAKLASSSAVISGLRECEEELGKLHIELEREVSERSRVEKNVSRLQGRVKDLQSVRDGLESQVEVLRKSNQDEVNRRKMVETELEQTTVTIREYASTISTLRQSQEKVNATEKRVEEERRRLEDELERSLRQNKTSTDRLNQLSFELKALQKNLLQEQARVKESNSRNEGLYKTIEDKSRIINENSVELQKLKELTEALTKERLRLEEELRAVRREKEELSRSKQGSDDELAGQITALELQLQSSNRRSLDHKNLVSELSSEREKLKLEIQQTQKQAIETSALIESTQLQYSELVKERDALLLKLKLSDQDNERLQNLENNLNSIKLSLESERHQKQLLQEENERVKKDYKYWKDQYESNEGLIRQYDSEKDRLEQERNFLKSEIERLMRELREIEANYKSRLLAVQKELSEVTIVRKTMESELKSVREPPTMDPSTLLFDGVRKPVTAKQLHDCGVLDKPTFNQLLKGQKSVPDVSVDKKVTLKGTGPIAGVVVESQKGTDSFPGALIKLSLREAKKENLLPLDCADLLLDAQAATGHIIDPRMNQKLTVEDACVQGVVDEKDRQRLLAAEAAAVGYHDPTTGKPLSSFQAMKKGLIDKNTALRLLQAQESAGGILDPMLSVFLPKDLAMERDLIDEDVYRTLNQRPDLYLDPETELGASYISLKRRCKAELHTGLLLLPVTKKLDPSKLIFDGVRKSVTAQKLLDCGVLDKPTFNQLLKGEKTVPEVSTNKRVSLKGTGPIAAVIAGNQGKMSFTEAKKQGLIPPGSANMLLEAQAATGHIIDPRTNQKLTVDEACDKGVVAGEDRERLVAAEAAAIGYYDPTTAKPLSVFEAMKKGLVDKKTALTLLQAQESMGGILDPVNSVFLPKDAAIKHNLLDQELNRALNQHPEFYLDPETELGVTYESLKRQCKTEPHTGLILLPITDKLDPTKLIFDGVRKKVTAQQLLECGVLDKPTFNELVKGEKTVPQLSLNKKICLKGTAPIAAVIAGNQGKMSFTEAKKQGLIPPGSANMLLEAQAATGHIIDPQTNQKLTVDEACDKGVVAGEDRERLLAAEAAAIGYYDPTTAKPISVFEAMKKGLVDKKTALTLLQAQESVGGILDPVNSVFLPKDAAIKHNLLDQELNRALNQHPECYLDPETELGVTYEALKRQCKTEPHTGLILLPITDKLDPTKLIFDGVRKNVTAQQLLDCGVLDKPTFNELVKGAKTVPQLSLNKKICLKGTGPIAAVIAGNQGKMSFTEAKKQGLIPPGSANMLLEAQAATGHIIDPRTNQKLTVDEACDKGVVAGEDRERLLAAEAAAIGYYDPTTAKPLSVFEAMKKGLVDKKTALTLLQAQESMGGILDPVNSVFLPKDAAIKHNLLDQELNRALNQHPEFYLDPETELGVTYESLKRQCKTEPHTGLILLPITDKLDPTKLIFDGVRKKVTAQQLLDCGVLDTPTFNMLVEGKKTVPEVSVDKKIYLKGTGSIGGIAAGPLGKMSFADARNEKIMSSDCANLLLDAQAATGHVIDPRTNQKLTVEEAYGKGVIDIHDRERLLLVEAAAVGYREPNTSKLLSAGQAMRNGLIDKETALRILQAQESVGGILDPVLSVFLSKEKAMDRNLIDEDLYRALNSSPECFLDPDTQQGTGYVSLKKKCKANHITGLLLLPAPEKPLTIQGLRDVVLVSDLVDANLLERSDVDSLREGKLTRHDIEERLRSYLRGSTCIAGVYDESGDKVMPIYQAMKEGLLTPGTTLELLEAQAASGFVVDPVNNLYLTVCDAYKRGLVGPEFKDKLLSAERAVTGYKCPGSDNIISIFEAMEKGLLERSHGIRLLEAQIASGGIIDPKHSHRIDVNVAYKRGYFNAEMNQILIDEGDDTKGFFDPNTQENLTYLELKKRCITDKKGLILLPILDKKKIQHSTQKNTLRKRRVIIVDPDTNREMSVHEAYDKHLIDYETFLELSKQECEWEEITISQPDGSSRLVIVDRKTGKEYDIRELIEQGVIDQSIYNQYTSHSITLSEFADIITSTKPGFLSKSSSLSSSSSSSSSSSVLTKESSAAKVTSSSNLSSNSSRPISPTLTKMTTTRTTTITEHGSTIKREAATSSDFQKHVSSVSISLTSPVEAVGEQDPVGAIFDTENLEKISILDARNRGIVDSITAQRLLEAQACTGGIVDPSNGRRHGIQEACRQGLIDEEMATRLKLAQKAFVGFEDVKTKKKMSAAEAMKEKWLPYEAGQRFMEFQFVTGGLYDPEVGYRRTIEDALKNGWVDGKTAQKLLDTRHHSKNLTCPKSKLKISYKEAMDNCLLEETTGVRMLQASTLSSRGISSPYNVSSAPGSNTGSRSGSQLSSRRSSVDLGSLSSSGSSCYSSTSYSNVLFTPR